MPSRGSGRSVSLWMVTAHGIEPQRLTENVCIVGADAIRLFGVAPPQRASRACARGLTTKLTRAPLSDTPWELRFLREARGGAIGRAVEFPELTR